ncbi:MAG TPA: hypothetical protein VFZ83_12835 [Acidimicrobiia bacterium]|nr:hypothetical protein [Acidimicrobiia bacterium]
MRGGEGRTRATRSEWVGGAARLAGIALIGIALGLSVANDADAQVTPGSGGDPIEILNAEIDGRDLASGTRDNPIVLEPDPEVPFTLTVRNNSDETVDLRFFRFELMTLGLNWWHYDLRAHVEVPPRAVRTISEPLDFFHADETGKGYIESKLALYDLDRERVALQPFAFDVKGDVTSTIGLFTIFMLALGIICIVEILVRWFRRRLPGNRFLRAVTFAFAAAVLAVTFVVGAAVLAIVLWSSSTYVPIIAIAILVGFVLGFLSPGPEYATADEDADQRIIDLAATEAVARASGRFSQEVDLVGAEAAGHESGSHVPAHESGAHEISHHSGDHGISHHSGGQVPVAHESGEHAAAGRRDPDAE